MKAKLVPIKSIKTNPKNPRVIRDEKFQKLVKSIQEFPKMLDLRPIVVNKSMMVLGGNQRLKACIEAGLKEVPILIADELTKAEQERFIITDNVNFGDWDFSDLNANWNLESLENWGLDIAFGLDETKIEAKEDDYEIPEEIKTDIVIGDLFEIGNHRLLCGDSTDKEQVEKLMNGEKADMVFTDPPYGVNYDGGHAIKGVRREKLKNDSTPDIYENVLPICYFYSIDQAPLYLWYSDSKSIAVLNAVLNAGYILRNNIIWNKNVAQFGAIGAQYKTKHEPCIYAYKKGHKTNWAGINNEVSVWDISRSQKNEFHPTQKPIELCARAIGNHTVSSVLDLFGGSGSTMVASHKLKKKSFLSEFDPKYCQVIIDRMLKLDPTLEIKKNGKKYVGIKKTK